MLFRSTLAGLPSAIAAVHLAAPAVIVIGDVAAFHDQLDWFLSDGASAGLVEERPIALPFTAHCSLMTAH